MCQACNKAVDYDKKTGWPKLCLFDESPHQYNTCNNQICNECYSKGIRYCYSCIKDDEEISKAIERAEIEIERLKEASLVHKEIYSQEYFQKQNKR
jgi:hypothetical protein